MKRIAAAVFVLIFLLSACSTPATPGVPEVDQNIQLDGLTVNRASAKLTPRAKVASDALQDDIERFTDRELVVDGSGTLPRNDGRLESLNIPQNLGAGDILISEPTPEAPRGMFVRITGVRQVSGDAVYSVEPASFDDAFEEFRLSMTKEMSAGEIASTVGPQAMGGSSTLNPQATLFDVDANFDDYVICDGDGNKKTKDDQIKVSGAFKANVKTFADIDINWRLKLKDFEMGVDVDERLNLNVSGKCGNGFDEDWHIKTYTFKSFTIWAGPVPVVFTPYVALYVGADGEVYLEVDIKAKQSFNGRYGVKYKRGDGWSGIKESNEVSPTIDVNTLQGVARARAYVGAKAGVYLYSVAGAYGFPKAFVDAEASLTAVPNPKVDYCLSAGLSLSVGANLRLNLIVTTIKKDWDKDFGDIIKKEILCKQEAYTGVVDDILPRAVSMRTLTVRPNLGSVSVSAPGVSRRCYSDCTVEIEQGARVTLSTGNANTLWWGDCTANRRSSCALTMSGDRTVYSEVLGPPGGPLY